MSERPFRPAREIAMQVRRMSCDDPSNYDSGQERPGQAPQHRGVLDVFPTLHGPPVWPWLVVAVVLLTGCALSRLGRLPSWGIAALAAAAAGVLIWPVFFTGYRGKHRRRGGDDGSY
jgi:hypothetical protein